MIFYCLLNSFQSFSGSFGLLLESTKIYTLDFFFWETVSKSEYRTRGLYSFYTERNDFFVFNSHTRDFEFCFEPSESSTSKFALPSFPIFLTNIGGDV